MLESDLRVHLAQQTERPVGLVDVLALEAGYESAGLQLEQAAGDAGSVVLFDVLTDEHLATIGRLMVEAQQREGKPLFVAGSSGVEYALTKHLQRDVVRS